MSMLRALLIVSLATAVAHSEEAYDANAELDAMLGPTQIEEAVEPTLAEIRFRGLKKQSASALRKLMTAEQWEPYSLAEQAKDKQALLSSGLFTSVRIRRVKLSKSRFRLDVHLREAGKRPGLFTKFFGPSARPKATKKPISRSSKAATAFKAAQIPPANSEDLPGIPAPPVEELRPPPAMPNFAHRPKIAAAQAELDSFLKDAPPAPPTPPALQLADTQAPAKKKGLFGGWRKAWKNRKAAKRSAKAPRVKKKVVASKPREGSSVGRFFKKAFKPAPPNPTIAYEDRPSPREVKAAIQASKKKAARAKRRAAAKARRAKAPKGSGNTKGTPVGRWFKRAFAPADPRPTPTDTIAPIKMAPPAAGKKSPQLSHEARIVRDRMFSESEPPDDPKKPRAPKVGTRVKGFFKKVFAPAPPTPLAGAREATQGNTQVSGEDLDRLLSQADAPKKSLVKNYKRQWRERDRPVKHPPRRREKSDSAYTRRVKKLQGKPSQAAKRIGKAVFNPPAQPQAPAPPKIRDPRDRILPADDTKKYIASAAAIAHPAVGTGATRGGLPAKIPRRNPQRTHTQSAPQLTGRNAPRARIRQELKPMTSIFSPLGHAIDKLRSRLRARGGISAAIRNERDRARPDSPLRVVSLQLLRVNQDYLEDALSDIETSDAVRYDAERRMVQETGRHRERIARLRVDLNRFAEEAYAATPVDPRPAFDDARRTLLRMEETIERTRRGLEDADGDLKRGQRMVMEADRTISEAQRINAESFSELLANGPTLSHRGEDLISLQRDALLEAFRIQSMARWQNVTRQQDVRRQQAALRDLAAAHSATGDLVKEAYAQWSRGRHEQTRTTLSSVRRSLRAIAVAELDLARPLSKR
jgi:hypothetical protein